jgi:hypothetical protein
MLMRISSHLRLCWLVFIGVIALGCLLPRASLHDPFLRAYVDSGWVHFLAYAAAATLSLLAWTRRTGIVLSFGLVISSVCLQILRAQASGQVIDYYGTVINILGITAGILLGLNILTLRSRAKQAPPAQAGRSH